MKQITSDMPREVAQQICYEEAGDLKARWMLIDKAEAAFNAGRGHVSATLIHAYKYLEDRAAYEREPWPKNMLKESEFPR